MFQGGVLIAANPRAGAGTGSSQVRLLEEALAREGYEVRVTRELAELAETAREWQASGRLRAVLTAGGDGTCSVARNHIPREAAIVPLPMGTENLLARYVRQRGDAKAVLITLRHGVRVQLDAGRAAGKLFLLMISAGLDAEVVQRLHEERHGHETGHITHTAYVKPILRSFREYQYPELLLTLGDGEEQGQGKAPQAVRCRWAFGFNLPCYACRLKFVPEANATDGTFDFCTFSQGSLWHAMRYLTCLAAGQHARLADCQITRGRSFRLEAANGEPVWYQVDGDAGGRLPVDIEVVPRGLTLLVQPAVAERHGWPVEGMRHEATT